MKSILIWMKSYKYFFFSKSLYHQFLVSSTLSLWDYHGLSNQTTKSFPLHNNTTPSFLINVVAQSHSFEKCVQCKVKKSIYQQCISIDTFPIQIHCSQIQWKDTKNVSRYVCGRYSIRYSHTLLWRLEKWVHKILWQIESTCFLPIHENLFHGSCLDSFQGK